MAKASSGRPKTTKKKAVEAEEPKEVETVTEEANEEVMVAEKEKPEMRNVMIGQPGGPVDDDDVANDPIAAVDAETHAKYEEIKRGETHITALQKMTVSDLHEIAKADGKQANQKAQ